MATDKQSVGLTERRIRDAQPGPKTAFLWDRQVTNLGVRITPRGAKAFVLFYRAAGRKTGTIAGSHLLTFFDANGAHDTGAWLRALETIAGTGRPVALICHGGKRSFRVARLLDRRPGDRRVYNARQGVSGWIAEDRLVVAGP